MLTAMMPIATQAFVPVRHPDSPSLPAVHGLIIERSRGAINDDLLARMLATWVQGGGGLPDRLGLDRIGFWRMLRGRFPGIDLPEQAASGLTYDPGQQPEAADLRALLLEHRARRDESEEWLADCIVVACNAGQHLWEDLGLWSRADLNLMMQRNFPSLAAANDRDMKWKKFLYRQLCQREGIFLCKSPTCDLCPDQAACFGPEI